MAAYFSTDQVADVLSSLREVKRSIAAITDDPLAWKWVVLALHSALQGALVCHLTGSANIGALEDGKKLRGWLAWLHNETKQQPSQPKLANLGTLLERLEGKERTDSEGSVLMLSSDEKYATERLSDFRDQLTHYRPMSWSIELSGMPAIIASVAGVIDRIAADGHAFGSADRADRDEIVGILAALRLPTPLPD